MSRKIIAYLKAAAQRFFISMSRSAAKSARVQDQIDMARSEIYRKHPEAFVRRGFL